MTKPPFYDENAESKQPADEQDTPSKSQLKREAEAITALGKILGDLSPADLARIPMEERVAEAVQDLRKISSFGARKRQLHYLGKILRNSDLAPIQNALDAIQLESQAQNKQFHAAERWRDLLLSDDAQALQDFLSQYPAADRQRTRQLVRNHHRDAGKSDSQGQLTSSKAARELFKLVRDAISQA